MHEPGERGQMVRQSNELRGAAGDLVGGNRSHLRARVPDPTAAEAAGDRSTGDRDRRCAFPRSRRVGQLIIALLASLAGVPTIATAEGVEPDESAKLVSAGAAPASPPATAGGDGEPGLPELPNAAPEAFVSLLAGNVDQAANAYAYVAGTWHEGYVPMALETLYLTRSPPVLSALLELLKEKTGQEFGYEIGSWQRWLWSQDLEPDPRYPEFKSILYGLIDDKFAGYFSTERETRIRLDEIVWGGVRQDGIPPLRQPQMIAAADADYLDDSNVVFGIEVNGDARAYPKRILAWHEMFVDVVGGTPVAGVYCTLCGTVILYQTDHAGINHELGTSGFLYRSNKLMYDRATQSLWSTMRGTPVVGPLVGKGITLTRGSVVTTTWGEWRRRHPDTSVLSLTTGHTRDYAEGAAYRDYFATDELMFQVPLLDGRLKNKDEVLALWFVDAADRPLAIAADFLAAHPVHHDRVGSLDLVVMTDSSGANRVYQTGDVRFERFDGDAIAVDSRGRDWAVTEDALTASDGTVLARLPAHRAFWFGWYSAFPKTRLVH